MVVKLTPKLTAIIPVLNPSLHRKTLTDILINSRNVVDIIFVIDNSDELSVKDLETLDFLKHSPHGTALIVHGTFGNPGSARNYGLKFVESEWITFWDADDRVWPEIYRDLVNENAGADVIVGEFETVRGTSRRISSTSNLIELAINPGLWRIIFRKSFFGEVEFPPLRMGEDQIFLMHLNLDNARIVFSKEILYEYNAMVVGQLTRSPAALRELDCSVSFASECLKKLSNHPYRSLILTSLNLTVLKQKHIPWSRKITSLVSLFGKSQALAISKILYSRRKCRE